MCLVSALLAPRPDYAVLPGEVTTTPETPTSDDHDSQSDHPDQPDEHNPTEPDGPIASGQSEEDHGTPAATTYAVPRMRLPVQVTMTPPDVIETPNAISSGAVGRPRAE